MDEDKPTTSDKTLVNLRIDKDLAERGKALAKRKGGNLSTLLRGLLIDALAEDERVNTIQEERRKKIDTFLSQLDNE